MFIAPLLASALMMSTPSTLTGGAFHCVMTHDAYTKPFETIDYNGVRMGTCCPGCAAPFMKDPAAMFKADQAKGLLFGVSLFDVVSGNRIETKAAVAHTDYKGVRYLFASKADLTTFKASPAKFTTLPTKQLLVCPVTNEKVASISAASGYYDFKGTRYYTCCADCLPMLKKDPAKYISKVASKATSTKAEAVK